MTITLPDALKADLERRAAGHGFATVDEYVLWLIEEEAAQPEYTHEDLGFRSQDEFEAFIQASLDSGPPITVDAAFWADLRKEVADRVARGKAS